MSVLSNALIHGQSINNPEPQAEGIMISLPELDRYSFIKHDNITIEEAGSYHETFHEFKVADLPVVDFTTYYLLGVYNCNFCLNCPPNHQQCHRNACTYHLKWFLIKSPDTE